jgi:hypothetical protein
MAIQLNQRQARAQANLIAEWEEFLGIPGPVAGSRLLGMNRRTYNKYRYGEHFMPLYVRHAMANIAQRQPAWGDPR